MNDVSITQLIIYDSKTNEFLLCAGETSLSPLIPSEPNFWRFPHAPAATEVLQIDTQTRQNERDSNVQIISAFKAIIGEKNVSKAKLVAVSRSPAFGMHPYVGPLSCGYQIS
jgi:hypothetical protein